MNEHKSEFEKAGKEEGLSIISEFLFFLRENKKWWLLPILLVFLLLGTLAVLSGSGFAPFIYTLF